MLTDHQPLSAPQRKAFHAIFAAWLTQAGDEDYQQLEEARSLAAPYQVCSAITLVRRCLADPALLSHLPVSLVRMLQERNWPQACISAQAA